ncbi:hypothetical protein PR048_003655 [Dryococelus australis]|uniref:Uncharacterized protein n=1 Tax=Dryococelus australis TaxID=614101 RepID=A0ABQ9INM4_9NEOP|nr:hypothetical protein PR048_003655 [Dryococelus australis]
MPLTAAEKMKRDRQRLKKKGLGDETKKNDTERKKQKRRSLTSTQLMVLREKERNNQRKCRSNVGNIFEENINDPTAVVLPVLVNHVQHYRKLLNVCQLIYLIVQESAKKLSRSLQEIKLSVYNRVQKKLLLYVRDDISWQSPGMKDYVIVKDKTRGKSKVQKSQEDEDSMLSKCANIHLKDKYSLDEELLQQMVRWDHWETMIQ